MSSLDGSRHPPFSIVLPAKNEAVGLAKTLPRLKDAFADVASAREDRNRIADEARGYANDLLPRARGEARKQIEDAQGYREKRINEARGDAARFVKAYEEYRRAKDVTSQRLYLEAMEEILPRLKTVFVGSQGEGDSLDISLLQRLAREADREKP